MNVSKITQQLTNHIDIFGEKFEGIDFTKQKISHGEFDDCTFISCNFSESSFLACKFIECRFENCNLTLTKFTDSKLSDIDFISCKMIGIDWTMADWKSLLNANPIRFYKSILNDSNFFGLHLENIIMKECEVKEVDFTSSFLKNGNFTKSDFKGSIFHSTNLEGSNFTDTSNSSINLKTNHLKGAIFNRYEAIYLLESVGIVLVD